MQVKLKDDVLSNYYSKKDTKSEPIKYASKGEICDVIAIHGDVYLLKNNKNKFPCHKDKIELDEE